MRTGKLLPGIEPGMQDSKSYVITNFTMKAEMPTVGLEPTTTRLKVLRSTKTELNGMIGNAGVEPRYWIKSPV